MVDLFLADLASFWSSGKMASINAVYIHIFLGVCVQATAACPWCSHCRKGSVPSWACLQGWSPLLKQVVYNIQYTEGKLNHQHHWCFKMLFYWNNWQMRDISFVAEFPACVIPDLVLFFWHCNCGIVTISVLFITFKIWRVCAWWIERLQCTVSY